MTPVKKNGDIKPQKLICILCICIQVRQNTNRYSGKSREVEAMIVVLENRALVVSPQIHYFAADWSEPPTEAL